MATTVATIAPLRTPTAVPVVKVQAGTLAGALSTLLIFVLDPYMPKPIPAEVAAAITTVLTFAVAYLTPPGPNDGPIADRGPATTATSPVAVTPSDPVAAAPNPHDVRIADWDPAADAVAVAAAITLRCGGNGHYHTRHIRLVVSEPTWPDRAPLRPRDA